MPNTQRKLPVAYATTGAVEKYRERADADARENFWKFRRRVHSDLLLAAWQIDLANHLQQFYEDYINNKKPKLVIAVGPQHGKSYTVGDFMAWFAGKEPDSKTIFASYSDDLGVRANLSMQRLLTSNRYREIFPNTRIASQNTVTLAGRWLRNSSMLEFVGKKGSFRNTTILGQINGQGLDLGVIDDPIKGRAEANSKVTRDKAWGFLMDDFFGRFSERAGIIMIATRWHVDDPTGRWLEVFPETKVCKYPAIATKDEVYRKKGEALFPQLKSIEFLNERKRGMTNVSFEAQYQQNPFIQGGGLFPIEKIGVLPHMLVNEVKKTAAYIDKAGCLLAGTLVETKRGSVPIESVCVGDLVLTQSGYQRVKRSWLSGHVNEITTVLFSDGSQLTGTPDHPVYVEGGYWIGLGKLLGSDRVLHQSEVSWQRQEIQGLKRDFSKGAATPARPMGSQNHGQGISNAKNGTAGERSLFNTRCIERFGSLRTAIYPVAMTSTTRTTTGITTNSKILPALVSQTTTRFTTERSNFETLCLNGIVKTVNECEQLHLRLFKSLSSSRAELVVANSLLEVQRHRTASELNVSVCTGQGLEGSGVPVYDLTVEDQHAFFANGILVHNTEDGGAYTAIVLMHFLKDGRTVVEDVRRGQWSALEREQRIFQTMTSYKAKYPNVKIYVEQEPGSGGKESAENTVRMLRGFRIEADKPTGDKITRADPFAAQVQAGNVYIVGSSWNLDYLNELEECPAGKYMDQVDASSGAFMKLSLEYRYDHSMKWLGELQ